MQQLRMQELPSACAFWLKQYKSGIGIIWDRDHGSSQNGLGMVGLRHPVVTRSCWRVCLFDRLHLCGPQETVDLIDDWFHLIDDWFHLIDDRFHLIDFT
jgi:hypothetical protein